MTDIAAHAAAAQGAAPPPVGPGLIGFLVVAAIGVALYFLVKSMNKQISKIEVPRQADLDKADRAETTETEPRPNGSR
ncbi:hypothetical protein ABZU32_16230 [Sphaerisporangium sp. NPDC005288]|uniref:Uncharacterized protein n=1 Tax=Sphaerisporangium rhizosphaerae TaxID=2269375 RepID=A0ABW2P5N4_9ACTN